MDITKLNIEELKILAYDLIVRMENDKRNMGMIQSEMEKRIKEIEDEKLKKKKLKKIKKQTKE